MEHSTISIDMDYKEDEELIVKPIQVEKFEMENVNENFPQHPTLLYTCSPTGSGKSTLVQYLLASPYNQYFNKIFYFCPTMHQASWKKFKIDYDRVYPHYSDADFEKVLEEIKQDEDEKCLIVIDDCTATNLFRRENAISRFVFNHRHFPSSKTGTSIWIISHQYKAIPKNVRSVIKDLLIFQIHSGEEIKEIAEDVRGLMSMKDFLKLYHLCTDEKYNFMYVKKEVKDQSERIRRNFNTIFKITYNKD